MLVWPDYPSFTSSLCRISRLTSSFTAIRFTAATRGRRPTRNTVIWFHSWLKWSYFWWGRWNMPSNVFANFKMSCGPRRHWLLLWFSWESMKFRRTRIRTQRCVETRRNTEVTEWKHEKHTGWAQISLGLKFSYMRINLFHWLLQLASCSLVCSFCWLGAVRVFDLT